MKRVTASEARQHWFRLLDEVVAGEVIVIERRGRRVVVREESAEREGGEPPVPDYDPLIQGDVDGADAWTWEWPGRDGDVVLSERAPGMVDSDDDACGSS